jgi:hypothetical protein
MRLASSLVANAAVVAAMMASAEFDSTFDLVRFVFHAQTHKNSSRV